MKTITLIGLVTLQFGVISAQKLKENQVPDAAKKAFVQKFANAKEVKWSKEGDNEFEAEFEVDEKEQSANFDSSGRWLITETEIKNSELPQPVLVIIAKEFADYKIKEAEKAESVDKGVFYEVELKSGKKNYEIQFSAEGKMIKKEEIRKEERTKG